MTESTDIDHNFDAMPGRALAARWVLIATLELETAAHFGGRGDSALDMPILRCARTGRPLLPGSSLGGALRAYLLDRLVGYAGWDDATSHERDDSESIGRQYVAKVFGGPGRTTMVHSRHLSSSMPWARSLRTPPPPRYATAC